MSTDSDLIAVALDFVTEYVLDDAMRKQCQMWETGTGEEDVELTLDRAGQIIRRLLANADEARRSASLADMYCATIESRLGAKDAEIAALRAHFSTWLVGIQTSDRDIEALTAELARANAVCEAIDKYGTEFAGNGETRVAAALDAWRSARPTRGA